ncbi:MAG TPA: hypothetical protein VHZ24_22860 [Pirellulales bacterium]|jgi:hypothetical protein|nr:hypothetical protein [Pirellulales bacterium]
MNKKHRLEGFKALLNSDKSNGYNLEEPDGSFRLWRDLSAQGRLQYIASAAALYDVPFAKFADAVRESVDQSAVADAALRIVLSDSHERRGLEQLLPDDGQTYPTPLIDRFKEILNESRESGQVRERTKDRDIEI